MVSFGTVVGHRRLTSLLSQAVDRGTLPPTLLFVGPPGVGKYRVAQAVAASINCLTPVLADAAFAIDACERCRACDRIARSIHVDVLSLEPDERASIKIDVVRDVLSRTAYRPFEGRRRVVIIREAETLEISAQNALLKSLEEPPAGTVFILTTALPAMLLPTVISRCMQLRFGRLSPVEIEALLIRDHEMSPRDAHEASRLADGSVGQALALGSSEAAALRESALRVLQQAASASSVSSRLQAAGTLVTSERKERSRGEVALAVRFVGSMLRDIELLNAGGDEQAMANPAFAKDLRALQRKFGGARARDAFEAVDKALVALDKNAGTKVVSEWLAVQI